jgi:hypothetical protein
MPEPAVIEQQPTALDWRQHIPEDVKNDQSFAPIIEKMTEKDIPSLVKSHLHLTRKFGGMVAIPGKDAKPEEVTAFKGKLLEGGYLPVVPDSPDKYEITKPEKLTDGVMWNDELAKDFRATAHKLGLTNDQAKALVNYHAELVGKMSAGYQVTQEQATAKLKEKWGADYDNNLALAHRAIKAHLSDPETVKFLEETGLGNHPKLAEIMAVVGANIAPDSSFVEDQGKATVSADAESARLEHIDIMTNPQNPKYKLFHAGEKSVSEYIDNLYKKAFQKAAQV